jgi:hypothetical protein
MLFCKKCDHQTLHIFQETSCNHILHLLLSIVTCGLWLPIWLMAALSTRSETPSCTTCGAKGSNLGLRFALAAVLFALLLAILVSTSHGQSNNIYDSSVRQPSRASSHHYGYIYYAATHVVYLEDASGELHAFMSYLCRYNPATHRSQWQLENGRWVEP